MCTVHANRRRSADRTGERRADAGENVTERIVQRVFSQALDLIVHIDRDDARDIGTVRRSGDGDHRAGADGRGRAIVRADLLARRARATVGVDGRDPAALEARVDRALPGGDTLRGMLESPRVGA